MNHPEYLPSVLKTVNSMSLHEQPPLQAKGRAEGGGPGQEMTSWWSVGDESFRFFLACELALVASTVAGQPGPPLEDPPLTLWGGGALLATNDNNDEGLSRTYVFNNGELH